MGTTRWRARSGWLFVAPLAFTVAKAQAQGLADGWRRGAAQAPTTNARLEFSRGWAQVQTDAARLRNACEDGARLRQDVAPTAAPPCCDAIAEFERVGSVASDAPAPPEFGPQASTAAACGFGREANGCRPGAAAESAWVPHASIAEVYRSEARRRRDAKAREFQTIVDAFKADDDRWRASDGASSPPSADRARAAIGMFRSCNAAVAAQAAKVLDDAEAQDRTLLAARRRDGQTKELQDATKAFEAEEKRWRDSLSSSDPVPDPIPPPPSSERVRAAIAFVRLFDSEAASNAAKMLDDAEERARTALADETKCRSTRSCNATRVAARAAAEAARVAARNAALAEEAAARKAQAVQDAGNAICSDQSEIRDETTLIARERSNPSGVVDLAVLHEAGERLQTDREDLARNKAAYLKLTGKPFNLKCVPVTQ